MGKGQDFERKMCKELGLWVTGGERDDVFWRTSQSGGRATTRAKTGQTTSNSYGDVMSLDVAGNVLTDNVIIELKKGYNKEIDLLGLIDGNKKQDILEKWWIKLTKERKLSGREYQLLILRRDRKKPIVIMSVLLWTRWGIYNNAPLKNIIEFFLDDVCVVALTLADFFEMFTVDFLKEV